MDIDSLTKIQIEKISLREIDNLKFVSDDTKSKFKIAMNKWVSDIFVSITDNQIVSFCFLMKEDLECGFLHYHIPNESKYFFIKKYPIIHQKTNQVLYLYTSEKFRKQGIATHLLRFIIEDLKSRDYHFLWLKKETSSNIYYDLEFFNFVDILNLLGVQKEFLVDYKKICHLGKSKLLYGYGDTRLVKNLI